VANVLYSEFQELRVNLSVIETFKR